jgi:1-deoxy-D-xylulose-5-phosphate reductoisomerase
MKNIVVLGSTGSIGRSTLDVIKHLGPEYRVWGLAARSNLELLSQQAREFQPRRLAIPDRNCEGRLLAHFQGHVVELQCGDEA